jgi:hypothetical protein
MSAPTPAKQTFTGSCHCGFVKYKAALPVTDPPVANRCNCTICLKQGFTGVDVAPDEFTLISPQSLDEVKDYWRYQEKSKDIHKYFCDKCGIHFYNKGKIELGGTVQEFAHINILTLDQPQEGLELSKFKIYYVDGRNDNWMAGTREVPWPSGCI